MAAREHYIVGDNLRHKAFYAEAIPEFTACLQECSNNAENPEFPIKAHTGLGLSYQALVDYPTALWHLTQAASMATTVLQKENDEDDASSNISFDPQAALDAIQISIARTHHLQAVGLQRQGNYEASIKEHAKALAIWKLVTKQYPSNLESLGGGETTKSPENGKATTKKSKTLPPPTWTAPPRKYDLELARTLYCMACAQSDAGHFAAAVTSFRMALLIRRQFLASAEHADVGEIPANVQIVLQAQGGALTASEIAEYCSSTLLESVDLELQGNACIGLGDISSSSSTTPPDWDMALVHYKQAVALEIAALGDGTATADDLHLKIAHAYAATHRWEQALEHYRKVLQKWQGQHSVAVAQLYTLLGHVLMQKGEYETALSVYCKAYGMYDGTVGNHPDTIQALLYVRNAAEKERTASNAMDILKRAEQQKQQAQWNQTKTSISMTEPPTSAVPVTPTAGDGATAAIMNSNASTPASSPVKPSSNGESKEVAAEPEDII